MWAKAPVLLPTEGKYSHLWFLPGWSLLTSSPSRYKHPQGLSYLLYMRAADELNQWLPDRPARSLPALAAEWLIFLTGLSASIIIPPQRTPEAKHFLFFCFFPLKFHMQGRKLDVCLWLRLTDLCQYWAVLWVDRCSCSMSGLKTTKTRFSKGVC